VLRGFYFRGRSSKKRRPLLILVNGSDGSALDMWCWGAAGATARGYDCLTFDGPGQGYALWKQGLYFRPDWERVVTPVVDFALGRASVDPKRIAIQGISQGGYWVPRALAFEKRIAAAIADPGVVDVSASWTATLPPPMLELLKAGRKDEFDGYMAKMLDPATKNSLVFRMRPYGTNSYYDAFKATMAYDLTPVAGRDRVPDADHRACQRGLLAGTIAAALRPVEAAEDAGAVYRGRRGGPALRAQGPRAEGTARLQLAGQGLGLKSREDDDAARQPSQRVMARHRLDGVGIERWSRRFI
jgi:pimeloyl-ACP methyl ester carboxylesterase